MDLLRLWHSAMSSTSHRPHNNNNNNNNINIIAFISIIYLPYTRRAQDVHDGWQTARPRVHDYIISRSNTYNRIHLYLSRILSFLQSSSDRSIFNRSMDIAHIVPTYIILTYIHRSMYRGCVGILECRLFYIIHIIRVTYYCELIGHRVRASLRIIYNNYAVRTL